MGEIKIKLLKLQALIKDARTMSRHLDCEEYVLEDLNEATMLLEEIILLVGNH